MQIFEKNMANYLLIISVIILLFMVSCINTSTKNTEKYHKLELDTIRSHVLTLNKDTATIYNYVQELPSNDDCFTYFKQISTEFYDSSKSFSERIINLEKIKNTESFKSENLYNKYFTYHYISELYILTKNYYKSIEDKKKAISILKQNQGLYYEEIISIYGKIAYILIHHLNDPLQSNLFITKALYLAKKYNVKDKIILLSYNIGYQKYITKNYTKALQYFTTSYHLNFNTKKDKRLLLASLEFSQKCYKTIGGEDSIIQIDKKINSFYKTKFINKDEYYGFLGASLINLKDIYTSDTLKKRTNKVLAYFLKNQCENRYRISQIVDYRIKNAKQQPILEKKLLVEQLQSVFLCGELDQYFIRKSDSTLLRLIELDLQNNNYKDLAKWYSYQNKLFKEYKQQDKIYLLQLEYFSKKELDYYINELSYLEDSLKNKKIKIILLFIATFCILFTAFYIFRLFIKNKQAQSLLKLKKSLLDKKNNIILEKNNSLNKLYSKLNESNKNLNTFIGFTAYDMQSPLKNIKLHTEQFIEKYKSNVQDFDFKLFEKIHQSSEKLNLLINDLSKYASIEGLSIKKNKIDSNDCIKNAINKLQPLIKETESEIFYPKKIPCIYGDKILIEQLFVNLLTNAIRFSKPNIKPIISISLIETKDNFIEFSVTDNGIGIKEKELDTIFKILTRIHINKNQNGTGIGLSSSKKIIENLGGKIWVDSIQNHGSIFYFTLPKYIGK